MNNSLKFVNNIIELPSEILAMILLTYLPKSEQEKLTYFLNLRTVCWSFETIMRDALVKMFCHKKIPCFSYHNFNCNIKTLGMFPANELGEYVYCEGFICETRRGTVYEQINRTTAIQYIKNDICEIIFQLKKYRGTDHFIINKGDLNITGYQSNIKCNYCDKMLFSITMTKYIKKYSDTNHSVNQYCMYKCEIVLCRKHITVSV